MWQLPNIAANDLGYFSGGYLAEARKRTNIINY